MYNEEPQGCPVWVREEKSIRCILGLLLDKLDRGVRPLLRITSKTVPDLFEFNENDTQYLWSLIEALQKQHHVLDITLERFKSGREIYEKAKIRLNNDSEDIVRQWLNRPQKLSNKEVWVLAVQKYKWDSEIQKQFVLSNHLFYPGKSPDDVIAALQSMNSTLLGPMTVRALSARHFWGDSKFLDNRLEYLEGLSPCLFENIQARQLLVNAYLPEEITTVLFIENQDTFLQLVSYIRENINIYDSLNNLALIYSAGYRGAAKRIRHEGNTTFSLMSPANPHTLSTFMDWWEKRTGNDFQVYFWGDLDYSGLGILAALRNTFPGMQAWKPGYDPMVRYHEKGVHHTKTAARKENQIDPGLSGCEYADNILLPIIRANELFVDQEIVDIVELEESQANCR